MRHVQRLPVEFALDSFHDDGFHIVQVAMFGRQEQAVDKIGEWLVGAGFGAEGGGEGGADVVEVDGEAVGSQQGFADDVFQFADITVPELVVEKIAGFGGDGGVGVAEFRAMPAEEVVHEQGNVLRPVTERGEEDGRVVEPVVEVLPELFFVDGLFEVAMGRGKDADVHADGFFAAEALDGFVLQHAEEFGLGAGADVADFVEEDGAVVGLFEAADAAHGGTGKGALFVTKEFAFKEGFGDGGAVDDDEGLVGPVAVLVDGAGNEFLAGAGFAADEDGDRLVGDAADFFVDALHGPAVADDGLAGRGGGAKFDGGGHAALAVNGFDNEGDEVGCGERFEDVFVGAEFGGFDGGLGRVMRGHEDDREARLGDMKFANQGQTGLGVGAGRAGELEVGEDDVEFVLPGGGEAGGGVAGSLDGVAVEFERPFEGTGETGVVVNDEDVTGHRGRLVAVRLY
ncbi:MAG: hypothetical protein PCFJNLEI_01484 [Verrucomicrobiae bacterium]|nr:hypothetical protein [Verrucomicrobiae bacterium]